MPFTCGSPPSRTPATARWMSDRLVIVIVADGVLARAVALPIRERDRLVPAVAPVIRGVGRDVHVADRLPCNLAEARRGDRAAVLGADRMPHRNQDRQARARGGQEADEGREVSAGNVVPTLRDLGRAGLTRSTIVGNLC